MSRSRGKYWKLSKRFWSNPAVRSLTVPQRLIALYCLTEPTNRAGLFPVSQAKAAEDLGLSRKTFDAAFAVVCAALGWRWDSTARVLWLPGWWKHNSPDNRDALKAFLSDLLEVPTSPLLSEYVTCLDGLPEPLVEVFHETIKNLDITPFPTGCPPPSPPGCPPPALQGVTHTRLRLDEDLDKTKQDTDKTPSAMCDSAFESNFLNHYPARNGRKLGIGTARRIYSNLTDEERAQVAIAVKHYAASPDVQRGFGIKDPARWLRGGKGEQPWKDWLEPIKEATHEHINGKDFRSGW